MAVQMRVILFLVFMTGFQLATSNGQNSTQDPCFGGGPCSQICRVVNGTAQCSCSENYLLRPPENTVCVYKHPCDQNPPKCSPLVCRREYGIDSYSCWCSPNFILVYNSSTLAATCLPVNGATGMDPCFRCSHSCDIVNGVSKCSCPGGYNLQPPEYTQCVANSTALEFCSRCLSSGCINVNGSTRCDCPPGFELLTPESTMCVDVDECAGSNPCPHPYSCKNTVGYYKCYCGPGYNENNEVEICTDTNECWEAKIHGQSVCPDNSTCINTDGSYRCDCNEGFTMVNGSCQSCSICPSSQQSQQETSSTTIRTHVDATKSLPERQSPSLTTNVHVMGATSVPHSSPEATTEIIVGVIVSVIILVLMMVALISIYICVRRGGCLCAAWRNKLPYVAMSDVQQQPLPEAEVASSTNSVMKTEPTSPFKTITFTFQSPQLNSASD